MSNDKFTTLNEKFGLIPDYLGLPLGENKANPEEQAHRKEVFERIRTGLTFPRIDTMAIYQRQRAAMPESDYKLDYILTRKELDRFVERPFDPNLDSIVETRNPAYLTMQRGKHRSSDPSPNKFLYSVDPSLSGLHICRSEITYDANGIAITTLETVLFAGDIRGNLVTVIRRQKRVQQK